MAIFSSLTGGPAVRAANAQRDLAGNVLGLGLPQVGIGQQDAIGYLGSGRDAALGQISGGVGTGRSDVLGGGGTALDILGGGTQAARDALLGSGNAYAPLDTLANRYGGATSLALGALGTRGQGGIDEANAAFRAGPAFNFNLDTGLDAINRSRNARGSLNSGNTDRDAQEYGAGLASREYGSWMDRLLGFAPLELSATSGAATGRAGVGRDLANLEATMATRGAGVAQDTGTRLADLALRGGLAGSGIEDAYGRGAAGAVQTGTGQRLGLLGNAADAYGRTYGDQATAEMQASGNLINLGQNLLRTAVGAGGLGGGGMNLNALGSSLPSFLRNGPAGGFSFA